MTKKTSIYKAKLSYSIPLIYNRSVKNITSISRAFLLIIIVLLFTTSCTSVGIATTSSLLIVDQRSLGNIVDDKIIYTKMKHAYINSGKGTFFKGINLKVYEGRVLLVGCVTNSKYKKEIEDMTWLVRGVKEVINNVVICEETPPFSFEDSLILAQLKSKLFLKRKLQLINCKALVYQGFIYMLGIGQTQKEIDEILEIASKIPGVQRVKSYILVQNDFRRTNYF